MPDVGEVSSLGAGTVRAETASPAPLTLGQKLAALSDNEKFLSASYADQTAVRQLFLSKLPEYQALDADTQVKLMNTVASAPPAYKDKSFLDEQKKLEADPMASATLRETMAYSKSITGQASNWLAIANSKLPLPWVKPLNNLQTKVLQGDPDAKKLSDYLAGKQGVSIPMPEGVRNLLGKIPVLGVVASPDLVGALGDLIGVTADIAGPNMATGGLAALGRGGTAVASAVKGALVKGGAGAMAQAALPLAAKVATSAATSGAFGVARAALVDPEAVKNAEGIAQTFGGWAAADAVFGGLGEVGALKKAVTRASAVKEAVAGPYPGILRENAGPRAEEMAKAKVLASTDPDFHVQPPAVQDMTLARENIAAKQGTPDPVARLQQQALVGPLARRGLDTSINANGDGTFRVRELPDAGGEIATVQNPQRGAQPKPLDAVTLTEASKEVARRYDTAIVSSDARLAKETGNLAAKRDLVDRLLPERKVLPLQEPPRSAEASPAYTAAYRAMLEAKKSYASALIDRKALDDYASTDVAGIRSNINGIRETLSAGAEDVVPMASRAAISEGERQMLEGSPGVKVINFTQSVKPDDLRTIGARKVFLDTDNPLRVKGGTLSESNAVGVYSHPMDEGTFARLQQAAQVIKQRTGAAVDPLDLAHTYAIQAGADAIEHADGSVSLLYPREQTKHVTDFVDPKTGRYYFPSFTKKGAYDESGVDVRATNKLAGDVRISQTVKQTFPDIAEPKVMEQFLAQKTIGELASGDMELLTKTAFGELNVPTERVRVARVEREPGDMSVSIRYNEGTTTVAVPKSVNGVLEQQAFLRNYTNALNEAAKDYHGGVEAKRQFSVMEKKAETGMSVRDPNTGRIVARGPLPELSPQMKSVLLDRMKRAIKGEMMVKRPAGAENPAANAVASNVFKAPTPGADAKMQLSWLFDATKKVPGTGLTPMGGADLANGTFKLELPGREPFVGGLSSVIDEFLLQNTTAGALRHDLALKGFDLKQGGGQVWVQDRNGKLLGGQRFDDHVTLMKTLGLRPDKIDGRFGPDSIMVNDGSVEFSYQGGVVSASLQKAQQFAAKFADMSEHDVQKVVLRQKDGTISKSKTSSQYVVDMQELGIHKTFNNPSAAFKYLRGEVYDLHNLLIDAENKGFAMYREDGKYVVSEPSGRHVVDTREQVRKVLATVPDTEWAPNLLGPYDKPILDSVSAPGNSLYTTLHMNWAAKGLAYARNEISNLFRPAQPRIEALAAKYKLPEVSRSLAELRTNIKIAEHQMTLSANATGSILGTDMPLRQRERFMEYMEASRTDVQTRILKDLFGQDTSVPAAKAFVGKAERMRDLLGATPTQGVFSRLGLTSEKFETNWMPRLQKMLAERPADVERYNAMPDGAAALMRELYGGNTPKNVAFISQYMRVSDFVDMARETDSVRALTNYYKQGYFWLHAGPAMEKFYNMTQGAGVPEPLAIRADHFIKVALGAVKNDYTAISKAMAREFGLISPEAGDLTNYLLNMGTSNIFLLKPWSAARQVPDAYMSMAPVLGGNEWLDRGFASVRKDLRGALQEGIDKRILSERLPTMEPTATASKFLSKYFTKAHELVQNGDVVPRMATYRAAGFQFEEGMKKLQENPALTPEKALYAWPYLHDGVRMQVQAAIAKGDYPVAKHLYGADLAEMGAGSFRPEDQGMARNSFGILGRAWGQLMTMPMQMNDLRYRVLTKGTVAQRVYTTGLMARNVSTVAVALNAAGIDGSSFLPFNDLTISGGPVFNQMLDVLTATSGNPQARDQAIKDLRRSVVTRLVPFGGLLQRAIKTVQLAEQGELWKAMLAATGTPIARGSLIKGATGQGFLK